MGRRGTSVVVLIGGILCGGCASTPPCQGPESGPTVVSQPVQAASPANAALEQKVKAQEKRIAELSMQLKLLKRIDMEESKR